MLVNTRSPDFGVVELSGEAHERGYQIGKKFSANISEMLDRTYEFFEKTARLQRDRVLKISGRYSTPIEEYSDEIANELKGMGEGSGRVLSEIVLLASFNEILMRYAFSPAACTSFCATGKTTKNEETYLGQNNDGSLSPNLDEYDFLMKSKTDSGVDFIALTLMGCPAFEGVNSKGIALCVNFVSDGRYRVGVPFSVIAREILGSKSIGEALDAVTKARRGAGANYIIADENGECYDVETTSHNFNFIYVPNYLAHANHYLLEKNVKDDKYLRLTPSTMIRCNRMNKLLNKQLGNIDLDVCSQFMKDHVNYPHSICMHQDENAPTQKWVKTMDSIMIVPRAREIWVTRNNPCGEVFKKYVLQ